MLKKLVLLFLSTSLMAGCTLTAKPADLSTGSPNETLVGTLIKSEVGFILEKSDGTGNVELDLRNVNTSGKEGNVVTVKGQYSGTTLFVDSVQ